MREAGDLANALFDRRGRMVAQAVTGTPGHINSLARAATAMLDEYPTDSLDRGDVLITNDPYKTAGQLLDVTVLYPVFRNGRVIAFFGSTIHHTDVGGYGIGAGARDVFEEGLWIPICKLMCGASATPTCGSSSCPTCASPITWRATSTRRSRRARWARSAVRRCATRHGLDDIEDLADEVIRRSEDATRGGDPPTSRAARTTARPRSTSPTASIIEIKAAVIVDSEAGEITVDYEGSSGASPYGINVVKNYTHAYTTFTVRSVLNPEVPNNHGSLAPIKVIAPEGSIVNAVSPTPCTARHVVGMFLPNALLKALAESNT